MQKLKHTSEFIKEYGATGNASTGSKLTFVIPFACVLKAIYAKVRTAGTTGTQSTDIKKNGTSIFSGSVKVDFATTSAVATYGPLTTDPTTFAKGDFVEVNTAAVNTTPAVDFGIILVFARQRQSAPPKMLTGSIDETE